jgi:hypothetical protein
MGSLSENIVQACRILFGENTVVTRDFMTSLDLLLVKKAYRKRALITHPDRLVIVGEDVSPGNSEPFIKTGWAYTQLINYLQNPPNINPGISAHRSAKGQKSAPQKIHYFRGIIPCRRLLFAEYLYYRGMVPWHAYIAAIVWQRGQRPRFGEIAKRWQDLTDREILWLLKGKQFYERIGEIAIRTGMMDRFKVERILHYQSFKQRKIGEYFVEEGYVTREILGEALKSFAAHNNRSRLHLNVQKHLQEREGRPGQRQGEVRT